MGEMEMQLEKWGKERRWGRTISLNVGVFLPERNFGVCTMMQMKGGQDGGTALSIVDITPMGK